MRKTASLILPFLLPFMLQSQTASYIFSNKGQRDGLSHNFCFSILKDSRGLLWIGTNNGLNRYDGYHFNNFFASSDSNSYINNTVLDLCEDKQGNIWGGTGSGIFCYRVEENRFINYIPPGLDYSRAVTNIICDQRGDIWATGTTTILKLNRNTNYFDEIGPLTAVKDSLSAYAVRQNGMEEDPSGKGIWLATRMGLHYYDISARQFNSYKNRGADSLFVRSSMAALSRSPFGYLWVFDNSTKDMIAFDPDSHKILYRLNTKMIIPDGVGQTSFEDSNHRLWLSSWNGRMAVLDYRSNSFSRVAYRNDNPLSIAGDGFWTAWEDENNTVWLGTAGGLSRCNYSKNSYSILPVSEKVKEFSEGKIGTITADPRDGSLWMASEARLGVLHFYPETGNYTFYDLEKHLKNAAWPGPNNIYNFLFINNQPHVVTHRGTWQINEKTGQLNPFKKKFNGLPDLPFYQLGQYGDYLWYSTYEGYVKWNKKTGESKLIKSALKILPDSQAINYTTVCFDKKGNPWFIPAFGWLGHVNEKDEVELQYYIKDKARELASFITHIQFDSKGKLWMSSIAAGVYCYNPATKEMKLFDHLEKVGTNAGYLTIDQQDLVWIASSQGFSVYNQQTGSTSNYYLPLNENKFDFSTNIITGADGSVYFTLDKNIARFMPERMKLQPLITAPIISQIKISGKEKILNDENSLRLEPGQNSLEFYFGSLVSNEVFPYEFVYRLDGFDKKWIAAGNTASALYSNLQPGKYVFRVKAISKNKIWETPEEVITIHIRTPFYKAAWFWVSVGLLLLAALFFFYRFRMNKQRQILTLESKARELEKEKTSVMYESLKQQLNPHFLFNSLTSLSGLIETNQQVAGNFLEQMSGIYRYILKNGDNETVLLKDEIEFVSLYINLQQTRFRKGLQVNMNVSEEYRHYKIAPVTLQNLIENAIKHNIIDAAAPLVIDIFIEAEEYLVVKNNLQKKAVVETSNQKGLAQFTSLYRYLSHLPVVIEETEAYFLIKIPLI